MEEENKNNDTEEVKENKINTDEILKETANTFNEVKDQVKGSFNKEDLKKNANETKNFIFGMFKNPIEELKKIADDTNNSYFKYSIILVVVWILAVLISFSAGIRTINIFRYILPIIKLILSPIAIVFIMSLIIFVMNKNKDKGLMTIISVVTATKLPVVMARVISLLVLFSSDISRLTTRFTTLCSVISTVLLYFGIKFIFNEDDDKKFIKTFAIIEGIYYIAAIIMSFLQISM